jgi:uncharacterized repeat protein (TIGR01451 family)
VAHTAVNSPILAIGLSAEPPPGNTVRPGDWITYTLTAVNDGVADATGVVISDTLDTKLHFVDVSPGDGVSGPNPLLFDVGTLPGNGGMVSYVLRVKVTGVTSPTTITNRAVLTSNEPEPKASNTVSHPVRGTEGVSGTWIYLPMIIKSWTG